MTTKNAHETGFLAHPVKVTIGHKLYCTKLQQWF